MLGKSLPPRSCAIANISPFLPSYIQTALLRTPRRDVVLTKYANLRHENIHKQYLNARWRIMIYDVTCTLWFTHTMLWRHRWCKTSMQSPKPSFNHCSWGLYNSICKMKQTQYCFFQWKFSNDFNVKKQIAKNELFHYFVAYAVLKYAVTSHLICGT